MATDLIRYDLLVQDALRAVMRKVLSDVAREGLPGDHHFFITFRTRATGVRLSNRMREQYPKEMTIVLQHQFWDLTVGDHAFEVGLSFQGKSETLLIPFEAVTGFFDPSVEFGLKFELAGEAEPPALPGEASGSSVRPLAGDKAKPRGSGTEPIEIPSKPEPGKPANPQKSTEQAKVVSLETFRKKP
ncbi:MAG TPA: ClpXP protease specificity-enhancing factor SspB [Methylovirgula sp.]|nr:ClpXP protease specificity-enhancing factor SspB [Methylovirgula sp.]